jgi:hypothetical protein
VSNTCALLLHGGKPIRSPSSSVADFVRILPTQGQGADRRGYALLCTSRAHQNCSAGEPHSLPLLRVSDLRQCHAEGDVSREGTGMYYALSKGRKYKISTLSTPLLLAIYRERLPSATSAHISAPTCYLFLLEAAKLRHEYTTISKISFKE